MEAKEEEGDVVGQWQTSPIQVLEEAVRVASEALQSVYQGNKDNLPPRPGPGHRRSHSETAASLYKRSNSFQRWKSQMQRALRLGSSLPEQSVSLPFDPEILADQKRQWYQLNSKILDYKRYKEPTSFFEHFIIAGLHPDANLEAVADSFVSRKKWELSSTAIDMVDSEMPQSGRPSFPSMDPQILFKYPPTKRLPMRLQDLAAFCFPSGVKANLLQRTASLSELNKLVYGQEHLSRDDLSFVFSLKVGDNATLYGVCLHVQEIVQRPLDMYGASSPLFQHSENCFRFLVAAPRCYCVLTRVPFFELHYEMLNSIVAQERLNRITQFVNDLALAVDSPLASKPAYLKENIDSPSKMSFGDLMASAIPVDCAMAITAAAAGIHISDDEVRSSSSGSEILAPESFTPNGSLDHSQAREQEEEARRIQNLFDNGSKASGSHSDLGERTHRNFEYGQTQYDGTSMLTRSQTLESLGNSGTLLSSSVRSVTSEEDDDLFFANDMDVGDDRIIEWAKETKNDLLQIVSSYHSTPLPLRGSQIVFQPLEHLQAIEYRRLPVSALGVSHKLLDHQDQDLKENAEVNLRLAAAEEAAALSIWTTATICRVLSLENILALFTGVLLEKQVIVVCPNLGVLAAAVLSLIPIMRPFQWQSLFLPILPEKMFEFLDAPVPYIVGLQHKPTKLKVKTSNMVQVNLDKDQVKMSYMPLLPSRKELLSLLGPIHAKLSSEASIAQRHPVYKCNEVQAEAAEKFLATMREYLESLCSDLRLHTITRVQSNNDRVSLLLKETFIDSFHTRDQPFVKMFVDTQMFSVLSDSRLSSYENEYL